ncbi:MAG: hypothetical protein QJR08_08040 [Bacillota bacterium]|nr:hypothetical protein [Bacillota bacterium]
MFRTRQRGLTGLAVAFLAVALAACSGAAPDRSATNGPGASNGSGATATGGAPGEQGASPGPISVDYIRSHFDQGRIVSLTVDRARDAAVVEAAVPESPSLAPRFWWYDLKTGERVMLPTDSYFVTLERMADRDHIYFRANGGNDADGSTVPPFTLEVAWQNGEWVATETPIFLPVSTAIKFGHWKIEALTRISYGPAEIQFTFGPIKGKEDLYYAATTDIPMVHVSYDRASRVLTVYFDNVTVASGVPQELKPQREEFWSGLVVTQEKGGARIEIRTTAGTRYYAGLVQHHTDQPPPSLTLRLAGHP